MNLIPNISPKTFSASAIIVGYLLIDDLTANEQNALGNWLMYKCVLQTSSTRKKYSPRKIQRKTRNRYASATSKRSGKRTE